MNLKEFQDKCKYLVNGHFVLPDDVYDLLMESYRRVWSPVYSTYTYSSKEIPIQNVYLCNVRIESNYQYEFRLHLEQEKERLQKEWKSKNES